MDKEIYVIIAGSREFSNYELLEEACDHILENKIKDGYKITVLSGHARGADLLGERYATKKGFEIKTFPTNFSNNICKLKTLLFTFEVRLISLFWILSIIFGSICVKPSNDNPFNFSINSL